MIYFVGAGCGAKDLITVRGKNCLEKANIIVYAGSLVNPELLEYAPSDCKIYNSAHMHLQEVLDVLIQGEREGKTVVRLHTGDPSIYGAIQEQMDALNKEGISYEIVPGVSACFGAAASLQMEFTLPDISQSLIITRIEGKTSVPSLESIESFAKHQTSMAIYLSASHLEKLVQQLIKGGYSPNTPAAIVYKASWPDEEKYITTIDNLAFLANEKGITKTAIVLVGNVIGNSTYSLSKLYDKDFETEYRKKG